MLPDAGANDALGAGDLPDSLLSRATTCTWPATRCCARARGPAALAAIARAQAAGATVSVDPSSAALLGAGAFLGCGGRVDLLLPNVDEARR